MAKSSQGAPGTSQTTQNVNMGPWAPQQPYVEALFKGAADAWKNYGLQPYPGQTFAGLNPTQTSALGTIAGMGSTPDAGVSAASAMNTDTINGKYLDPSTNPYLTATYNAAATPVTNSYMTATAPQTSSAFSAAGRYGSGSYNNAVSQNQQNLGTTLNNLATNIYSGNYQNERQNQITAAGMAPGLNQASFFNPTQSLLAGNQEQQNTQGALSDAYNQYQMNQMMPWQNAQMYQGLISGNYGQSGTTSGTTMSQQPYSTNPASTALGGLLGIGSLAVPGASGVSALGNLFGKSDRRLKKDILRVATVDGVNVYSFRFKDRDGWHVGPIAQEVIEAKPSAVICDLDGSLMVDYAAVFKRAA